MVLGMLLLLQCENWGELSLLSNKSESLLDAFVEEEENGLDIAFQDIEQDGRNMSWIPAFYPGSPAAPTRILFESSPFEIAYLCVIVESKTQVMTLLKTLMHAFSTAIRVALKIVPGLCF